MKAVHARRPLRLGAAAVVALAAVVAFVLGDGSIIRVDTGPLGGGPVNGAVCGPGHTVVIADDALQNSTGSPILVERFMVVDPRGLRVIGVDLVPVDDNPGIGFGSPYPPSSSSLAGWDGRRALPMTMTPGPTRWDLTVGLERTARTGTLSYYELLYQYRGTQYLWTSQTAVKVVPRSCL